MNQQLHAIKTARLEPRVAKVQKMLAEDEGNLDDIREVRPHAIRHC
jgi:hypothetical protein